MTQGNYRPVAGTPLNPRQWREAMDKEQQKEQQQPQEAAQEPAQTEAQAQPQVEAQGPTQAEREAIARQQAEAAALLNGSQPFMHSPNPGQAFQLPLQAPDGGPVKLAPELVAQARMLAIGAGIGGALVLIWWTRAQAQRSSAQGSQVASGEADK